MTELEKYKEAFRIACHNYVMLDELIYGKSIIKEMTPHSIAYTDEYHKKMEECQQMFLEMADEDDDI